MSTRIPVGSTDRYIYFVAVDPGDLKTRETGLTNFTVYSSRNGAASHLWTTPTINEVDATNMPGVYELLLDEEMSLDDAHDSEEIVVHIEENSSTMLEVSRVIEIYRPKLPEGGTFTGTSGTAQSGSTASTIKLATAASSTDDAYNEAIVIIHEGTGAGQARLITDYTGSTRVADVHRNWDTTPDNTSKYLVIDLPILAVAMKRLEQFYDAVLTFGAVSDAGPLSSDFDTDLTEASDDHYNGSICVFTTGNLKGQARKISNYTGSSKNIAVAISFTEAPADTDEFVILGRIEN